MSQILFGNHGPAAPSKTLRRGLIPIAVNVTATATGIIEFSNGSTAEATCLRCPSTPCMTFADSEVVSASLPEFPADRNPSVCPTGAITKTISGAPSVNPDACMFCGVCASRCPVGAIYLNPYAVVKDQPHPDFLETRDSKETAASFALFSSAARRGVFLEESDDVVDELRSRMERAWKTIGDRFPDHLARNLLIAAGVGAAMRRKGDVFARMDLVLGAPWPMYGCAEAEFGDVAVLDAPRDLLDDVAVSVGRLGKPTSLIALVVTDVLPNRRSEYWRIVQDIRKVVGLSIGTVTVLALCMIVWSGRRMRDLPNDLFHVDIDTPSYRQAVLEPLVGRPLRIGSEPRPSVDIAK
ncbi:ATP-binding protein [Caballeronia zhejiangensis]|uniref:ATP-binding protein n=1 Tax=Caballeronia zhejiangensis TaxID=871203 RepID=UPI003D316BFB|nr:4Fe-4S binding protein [Caballeronia zhejiangensis]